MKRGIRVLIVDNEPAVLRGLTLAMKKAGMRVQEAISGQIAIDSYSPEQIDIVLVDMVLGTGKSGRDVIREIRLKNPGARIIAMTSKGNGPDEFISTLRPALVEGIVGVFYKTESDYVLIETINKAYRGEEAIPEDIRERMVAGYFEDELTRRVLKLLMFDDKEIATVLDTTPDVINRELKKIYRILDVTKRSAALYKVMSRRLFPTAEIDEEYAYAIRRLSTAENSETNAERPRRNQ